MARVDGCSLLCTLLQILSVVLLVNKVRLPWVPSRPWLVSLVLSNRSSLRVQLFAQIPVPVPLALYEKSFMVLHPYSNSITSRYNFLNAAQAPTTILHWSWCAHCQSLLNYQTAWLISYSCKLAHSWTTCWSHKDAIEGAYSFDSCKSKNSSGHCSLCELLWFGMYRSATEIHNT